MKKEITFEQVLKILENNDYIVFENLDDINAIDECCYRLYECDDCLYYAHDLVLDESEISKAKWYLVKSEYSIIFLDATIDNKEVLHAPIFAMKVDINNLYNSVK